MGSSLKDIEGIGPAYGARLIAAGIKTTDALLKHCAAPAGRRETAARTGLSEDQLLKWANMAHLMRVRGVGEEYSELLEAAGVDTVKELRNRNAENLATRMAKVNTERKLVRQLPSSRSVARWIAHAKTLAPILSY